MKKRKLMLGLAVTGSAFLTFCLLSTSNNLNAFFLASNNSGDWVHYAMKPATKTTRGVREYWIKCGGTYQFSQPTGVTIREGTQYDTTGFNGDTDPRWVDYTGEKVYYDLSTSSYDFCEISDYSDYVNAASAASDTYGTTKTISFSKNDDEPSVQFEVLTVSKVLKTKQDFCLMLKENGAAQTNNVSGGFKGYYVLGNDIDCEGITFTSYANDESLNKVIPQQNRQWSNGFAATFDGSGHAVKNFTSNWLDRAGIFGDISDGTVKNTLFYVNELFKGNSGILAYAIGNATVTNNMLVFESIRDYSYNASICRDYRGTSSGGISNNVSWFKSINTRNTTDEAALICRNGRNDKTAKIVNNVGISSETNRLVQNDIDGFYTSKNAKVNNLDGLFEQANVSGYEFINNYLTIENGAYYWGKAKICDADVKHLSENIYVEKTQTESTIIDISSFASNNVLKVTAGGKELEYSVNGDTLTLNGNQFNDLELGETAFVVETDKYIYESKFVVADTVIRTKSDLYDFLSLNSSTLDSSGMLTGYYVLANSIDCGGDKLDKRSSTAAAPRNVLSNSNLTDSAVAKKKGFAGTFDGCGHAIFNFELNWLNEGSLFGAICDGGTVKNTLFKYKEGAKWNGYKGIVAQQITGNFNANMVILDSINDSANNGIICYKSFTNPSVKHNIVYYRGTGTVNNAKLFCNCNGNYQAQFLVGITKASFAGLTGNSTNDGYCKVVEDLAGAVALKTNSNYKTAVSLLDYDGTNYKFGNFIIE